MMDKEYKQMALFEAEETRPQAKRPKRSGGSQNPIVFRDYESYVAKFRDTPRTTDDTFTPRDVYEAVVDYVRSVYDMKDKVILRPFYPGGDYENAEYPENGVVIDNPPFSMFTRICKFYVARGIPFFLFGPGMTIGSIFGICTAVFIGEGITFDNKANVRCNFASSLFGDVIAMTAPALDQAIRRCKSQNQKVNLPTYVYPPELLSVSDMQTIARGGIAFSVTRREAIVVKSLDNHPKGKGALFGDHLLTAAAKAAAKAAVHIRLSEREQRIVSKLNNIK